MGEGRPRKEIWAVRLHSKMWFAQLLHGGGTPRLSLCLLFPKRAPETLSRYIVNWQPCTIQRRAHTILHSLYTMGWTGLTMVPAMVCSNTVLYVYSGAHTEHLIQYLFSQQPQLAFPDKILDDREWVSGVSLGPLAQPSAPLPCSPNSCSVPEFLTLPGGS